MLLKLSAKSGAIMATLGYGLEVAMDERKITDAEFRVITPPRKPAKRRWRYNWGPLIGAAILGLPALLKALGGH